VAPVSMANVPSEGSLTISPDPILTIFAPGFKAAARIEPKSGIIRYFLTKYVTIPSPALFH